MSAMFKLSAAIRNSTVDLSQDLDLPRSLTNIYACSVYPFSEAPAIHTYIAGQHTAIAVALLSDWCEMRHDFRPLRSTCKTPVRRLKMCDLIENPAALDTALANAKALGNMEAVTALRLIPGWISEQTGIAIPQVDYFAASLNVAALTTQLHRLTGLHTRSKS